MKNKKSLNNLKVALVHDYLSEYGGAERVIEALHDIFPDAPVYVAFKDFSVTGVHAQKFQNWDIKESWITKIPFYKKLFSPLRIFAPNFFSSFDLSDYDLVISSTNAYFSKAVTVKKSHKKALHISYCHTPARSLYGYSTMTDWKSNPILKFGGMIINHYLRIRDFQIARGNVDFFIANSQETQRRIKKFYRLDSTVIYPPIEIDKNKNFSDKLLPVADFSENKSGYLLIVGRIAASKHVDLAVKTATKYKFNLKVVGNGKGIEFLKSIAGPTVEFLINVDDAKLTQLYDNASALLYPAEDEDFGMVPIEAMGHGVPVIAHKSGGPLETIIEAENGLFFDEFSVENFAATINKLKNMKWNKQKIYKYSLKFSKAKFSQAIKEFIEQKIN